MRPGVAVCTEGAPHTTVLGKNDDDHKDDSDVLQTRTKLLLMAPGASLGLASPSIEWHPAHRAGLRTAPLGPLAGCRVILKVRLLSPREVFVTTLPNTVDTLDTPKYSLVSLAILYLLSELSPTGSNDTSSLSIVHLRHRSISDIPFSCVTFQTIITYAN